MVVQEVELEQVILLLQEEMEPAVKVTMVEMSPSQEVMGAMVQVVAAREAREHQPEVLVVTPSRQAPEA
jgi:hypothetical protein